MTSVATVALLRKKEGMDAALFSKYWRDVHGMLATRIPGFCSYVQYHLAAAYPLAGYGNTPSGSSLHGIAVVDFDSEEQRGGLANSEVAGLIREDENNLFQNSLLYNLPAGADALWQLPAAEQSQLNHGFLLLRGGPADSAHMLQQALQRHPDIRRLRPSRWNGAMRDTGRRRGLIISCLPTTSSTSCCTSPRRAVCPSRR